MELGYSKGRLLAYQLEQVTSLYETYLRASIIKLIKVGLSFISYLIIYGHYGI
jgi:hypothetical protein